MSLRKGSGLLITRTAVAVLGMLAALPSAAQYPGQVTKNDKDSPELRAIAVLEWTGEAGKPKASRLVPVAVLDAGQLQDGGIYLARPEPLALAGEVEYELEQNGKPVGLFDISNAGQEQGSWVGYGSWKPMPERQAEAVSAGTGQDPLRRRRCAERRACAASQASRRRCTLEWQQLRQRRRFLRACPAQRSGPSRAPQEAIRRQHRQQYLRRRLAFRGKLKPRLNWHPSQRLKPCPGKRRSGAAQEGRQLRKQPCFHSRQRRSRPAGAEEEQEEPTGRHRPR